MKRGSKGFLVRFTDYYNNVPTRETLGCSFFLYLCLVCSVSYLDTHKPSHHLYQTLNVRNWHQGFRLEAILLES